MSKELENVTEETEVVSRNFIENIIDQDIEEGHCKKVVTRFPPEPNGYLHIGHAKSILLNSGLAEEYNGTFHLRFDDTNPMKEKTEFVDSIMEDVKWICGDLDPAQVYYASDYFDQMYECAVKLIKKGKAYVCDLTADEIREYRGTLTEPGKDSPYRERSVEENLDLFERMKNDEFQDGEKVLRAKIDMASPNINMRDPIIYRVAHMNHHNTGDKWCIYPMYDFAHPIEDAIEGISHSICTLEFEDHRPLYDWVVRELEFENPPKQIEFSKLYLTNVVTGKRYIKKLVEENIVDGWDDPRMPTLCGMRRRGYSPESIRKFIDSIGYTKFDALNDMALLEAAVREDLNAKALRVSAVINPVKLVITNYSDGQTEDMEAINNPENEAEGTHNITFSKELWIEREDFMEDAPKKFFRMTPGKEVRLKNAYIVKCTGCTKDENGIITEIQAEYDPTSKSGMEGANRKVKGTLHWVSVNHCKKAEIREYDRLFCVENPSADERDFRELINPESLKIRKECFVEDFAATKQPGEYLQFQRIGYFMADKHSTAEHLIFNKTVGLKDNWAKKAEKK